LAIADEHPGAWVTAIDVSPDALALAGENASTSGLSVTFVQHDVREGLEGTYDLVVSNPPYVTAEEIEMLEPEVRDWEPRIATVGADHTAVIAGEAARVLVPGGHLVLEVADGRGEEVAGLLAARGYGTCARAATWPAATVSSRTMDAVTALRRARSSSCRPTRSTACARCPSTRAS
jgi:release factor glutamine methyltransferase